MELTAMLKELSDAHGVSGVGEALDVAEKMLSGISAVSRDTLGGMTCTFGKGKRRIMLDAHIDEIGFIVTAVEDGFLRVGKVGGIDPRTVIGQRVKVYGKQVLNGVFASLPPHLKKEDKDSPKLDDLAVDCGLNADLLEETVQPGDMIAFDCDFCSMIGDRVTGKSLDNRAGVAAVISAARIIAEKAPDVTVTVSLSAQEELGLRGARTASFADTPDEAIVVDVSFGDGPDISKTECGKLGDGAMIGISPILDRGMTERLFELADKLNIKYQSEVMGGSTGTNADVISVTKGGVKCALISIPLRNMHTACEVVDLSDIESVVDLIVAYVCDGGVQNA